MKEYCHNFFRICREDQQNLKALCKQILSLEPLENKTLSCQRVEEKYYMRFPFGPARTLAENCCTNSTDTVATWIRLAGKLSTQIVQAVTQATRPTEAESPEQAIQQPSTFIPPLVLFLCILALGLIILLGIGCYCQHKPSYSPCASDLETGKRCSSTLPSRCTTSHTPNGFNH